MSEMDDIYRICDNLYIGAYWPQLNFKKISNEGITAIVNLMEERLYTPPFKKYYYLHKGFPDNSYPPHDCLKEILSFIDINIKEKKGKVLVHCSMGISRSGAIVIAWLLKENPGWKWSDALKYVWNFHKVLPAVEIRESILDYFESIEGRRRDL